MNNIKLAVIGAGYWGKNLIRNFYELGALSIICDTNEKGLIEFEKQYKNVKTTTNYNSLLNDPDITGIVIALPAELHYSFAKKAINAGKHVYIEKPLTIDITEGEELVNLSKSKDTVLMVGHLLQYHPAFIHLKKMVYNGELGELQYIYSNRLSLGKIRQEENVLWSFAPHDISMILSLCRKEPDHVSAVGGYYLQNNVADVTMTHMTFPSGIKAHIFVSWLHPYKEQKLVVIGSKKMAVFSDTEDWDSKLLLYSHSIEWKNEVPIPKKADAEKVIIDNSEPLRNECLHFIDCIKNKKIPLTDGDEGLRVLKVLKKAQQSLEIKI